MTACREESRKGLSWANRIFFSGLAWPHGRGDLQLSSAREARKRIRRSSLRDP